MQFEDLNVLMCKQSIGKNSSLFSDICTKATSNLILETNLSI